MNTNRRKTITSSSIQIQLKSKRMIKQKHSNPITRSIKIFGSIKKHSNKTIESLLEDRKAAKQNDRHMEKKNRNKCS